MSLVVRLQGLPAIADSFDIRQFFSGLNIPTGCVYITGGKYGEAYIVFGTCEDAQQALSMSSRSLKDSCVHLTASNEEQMRRALEVYRISVNPSVSATFTPEAPPRVPEKRDSSSHSYLYMCGLPLEATRRDIQRFFRGLRVEDILHLRVINGGRLGKAIVKFSSPGDATEALRFNNRPICLSPVILKPSDEEEWEENGGDEAALRQRSPPRPGKDDRKRSRSRSPMSRRRDRRRSPYVREYYVRLVNLSYRVDKQDIKSFFNMHMEDSHITFLLDRDGRRTREAFAMFTSPQAYKRVLGFHKETFKDRTISIMPISKRAVFDLISMMKVRAYRESRRSPRRSSPGRRYLYLRNFAFDVTKTDVQKFFTGTTVTEDDVSLLYDNKGLGLGEALVKYADAREASKAERENNETYQGVKILLSRITGDQMRALLKANQLKNTLMPDVGNGPLTSLPNMVTRGALAVSESGEVGMHSDPENLLSSNKESGATSGSTSEAQGESESVQAATPSIPSSPTQDPPDSANGGEEPPSIHSQPMCCTNGEEESAGTGEEVTLLFARNLPASVTIAEILDFFQDYKVNSVNLKNIEHGEAAVRMLSHAEALSAMHVLNRRELGLKPVLLSLT
ncbi:hypothetical protein PRIEUP_LOCUS813 [Pristimantis euphronides]